MLTLQAQVRVTARAHPALTVRPIKQARSQATHDKLVGAGLRLIEERDFDTLSVAEIASAAGCSVGTLYFRFTDKDGFFRALSQEMLSKIPDLGQHNGTEPSIDDVAQRVVDFLIAIYRQHRGLLRAAIRFSMTDEKVWEPYRAQGQRLASAVVEELVGQVSETRIRFAMQMLYSTLNNSILIGPGPVRLEDDDFGRHLTAAFIKMLS